MQLNNQDFAEVLEALREGMAMANLGSNERRQMTRVAVQTAVYAAPLVGAKPGNVRSMLTRDMSLAGICLIQGTPVGEDDAFIVKLPKMTKRPVFMLVKPVNCRLLAESIYAIGAEFVSAMNLEPSDAERFERPDAVSRLRASVLT